MCSSKDIQAFGGLHHSRVDVYIADIYINI